MEFSEIETVNRQETPKRAREFDDISPNSQQNLKVQKPTLTMEQKIDLLLADNSKILLELSAIRSQNDEFQKSLKNLDGRVSNVESEVQKLKLGKPEVTNDLARQIQQLKVKNNELEQSLINNTIIIRNLPHEIGEEKNMHEAIKNIFNILEIDIDQASYKAFSKKKDRNDKVASIEMKFVSSVQKEKVVSKFREMRKNKQLDVPFAVEKIIGLTVNHELNGKTITISNKLTPHSFQLLQHARKHVPATFTYAYDTPDGSIKVKKGSKTFTIRSIDDVEKLIGEAANMNPKNKQETMPKVRTRSMQRQASQTDMEVNSI